MRRAIEVLLAVGLAALVLLLTSGVALASIIALVVLVLCAISFGVEALVRRRR